jgi:hypothetical protein
MRASESPGLLKKFRRSPWKFQRTFRTPLQDLARFTHVIMSTLPTTERASAIFEQVVFEPRSELLLLFAKYSLPPKWYDKNFTIEAECAAEAHELLQAMLSEWIDFLFVPTPRRLVIYADHDEYTTFLANRRGHLSAVVAALNAAKFHPVDWVREL